MTRTKTLDATLLAALIVLTAACAAPVRKKEGTIFFPPAPALPRIQYLTSYTGSKDVESQTAFDRFVVGEKVNIKLDKPYGTALFEGKLYVCDTNATVVVFDLEKKTFSPMKGGVGQGKFVLPTNIFIEPDGTKYVADPGRGQIVVFDRNDDYVKAYGLVGNWRPVDVVTFEDRLYVADVANGLVRVFDKASGDLVRVIGDRGAPSERLDRPTNLAVDREGDLYVTDFGRFQVLKFDRDGHFKATFGEPGDGPGHFARPKGIAVDRNGQLYVADASYNNVQIFNKDQRILMFFGQGGENPGSFLLPAKVSLDYDNLRYFQEDYEPGFQPEYLILVTAQFGPRLVNVFAYGHQKGAKYPTDEELLKEIEERKKKELEKLSKEPEKQEKPPQP